MDPKAVGVDLLRQLEGVAVNDAMTPPEKMATADRLDILAAHADASWPPGQPLEEAAQVFRRLAVLESWTERRPSRSLEWLKRAEDLAASDDLRRTITDERRQLEYGPLLNDIVPLVRARKIGKARKLLTERLKGATSDDERSRIRALLAEPRNFLTPVNSAPSLSTLNGLGSCLYGRRRPQSDGTYIATLYFVIAFIPLLPISSYLVRKIYPGWQFLGKVPLSTFQTWWRRFALVGPLFLLGLFWGAYQLERSSWWRESTALSMAEQSLAHGNPDGALASLSPLRLTQDPERRARAADVGAKAVAGTLDTLRHPGDIHLFLARSSRHVDTAWTSEATADQLERIVEALVRKSGGPPAVAGLLRWTQALSVFAGRRHRVIAKAADLADDPDLDTLALGGPGKASALDRMEGRLKGASFPGWDAHALVFIAAATPDRARPILYRRAENCWKGKAPADELINLKILPEPLNSLLQLDLDKDLPRRVAGLEAIAEGAGIAEPQRTWQRLGAARRLSTAYAALNNLDPVRWPTSKGLPWTLRAHDLEPDDSALRVLAMRGLLDGGDFAHAIALGETAVTAPQVLVWLGVAYARAGRPAEAVRTLRPYVAANLETYTRNYEDWAKQEKDRRARFYRSLNNGTAPRALIERLNRMPDAQADLESEKALQQILKQDAYLKKCEDGWKAVEEVFPAAVELAMAELALAGELPAGTARQAGLKEAERLFVQLRRVSDDPQQDLHLAQIYYWLGKPVEGQAIFDKLEKSGDGPLLYRMGGIARELGRSADARRVLEAAYAKLSGEMKFSAALRRSQAWFSLDDRQEWLRRADPADAFVKSELAQVEGEVLLRDGRHAEAVPKFKQALAYYGKPESAADLNNAALLELSLARTTGEPARVTTALAHLRRAAELNLQDGIILSNYVDVLVKVAYGNLSGNALRVDLLHSLPSIDWLDWMPSTPAPDVWLPRVRAQAELRRSAEVAKRLSVLSPDDWTATATQVNALWLRREPDAVRALRESLESRLAALPPQHDSADAAADASADNKAPPSRRLADLIQGARKAAHPPSLAFLLLQDAAETFDEEPEKSLERTLEARTVYDCPATRMRMAAFRGTRALQAFEAESPPYKEWSDGIHGVPYDLVGIAYFILHPDRRPAFEALEDTRKLSTASAEAWALPPPGSLFRTWRALFLAGHPKAKEVAAAILKDGILLDSLRIDLASSPGSARSIVHAWVGAHLYGDTELAERIAADARRLELLPALFGK